MSDFRQQQRGAKVILKDVPDAQRFGVAEMDGDRILGIEEKPAHPKSNYAVTGIYMYDSTVFEKIQTLEPSARGELEITDVNNLYVAEGTLTFSLLEGWWTDAGTVDSLRPRYGSRGEDRRESLEPRRHENEKRGLDQAWRPLRPRGLGGERFASCG